MKTISRYLMTLALLLTAVTGAWATEEYESFDLSSGNTNVNGTHFNITGTSGMNNYGLFLSGESVTVTSLNGENITRVEFIIRLGKSIAENITGNPGTNSCTNGNENGSITDINATSVTLSTENSGSTSVSIKQITVYYGNSEPAAPDVEVTTNAASEGATFTEASFQMPAFDATADYELVRDMSVQMTAQVGDDPAKEPRYRVKKDGDNKFIPADMEMAAVPALFTVNDAIEQKALTQTQDYIVQIYAIDAEGQPTGDPMTFATFTFEPGIYAVKAVAAQGSDYDGETALSNTFKLFQGYEVEVPAHEYVTYCSTEALTLEDENAALYTITAVSNSEATLSRALTVAPATTPLLVENNSDESRTILLIPTDKQADDVTPATEFKCVLDAEMTLAKNDNFDYYAFNGLDFVYVVNEVNIPVGKCFIGIQTGNLSARSITIRRSATAIGATLVNSEEVNSEEWFDLNGRKVNKPTKKGIYIKNGQKVVIK